MILNGLGFVGRTLYLYSEYFEDKPRDHLLGKMKYKKLFFVILLVLSFFSSCRSSNKTIQKGRSVSSSSREVLTSFFKNLFENSSAGYVICGEKPIYLGAFYQPERVMPGSPRHKEAIYTFLSLKLLKTFSQNPNVSDYILTIQDLEGTSHKRNEFLLINRKSFLKVVRKNLLLFQYKFGCNVTPIHLLDKLVDPNYGFPKLLGKEIALQGIVLGYGTNNSISYEKSVPFTIAVNTLSSPLNKVPPLPQTDKEMIKKLESKAKEKGVWNEMKDISYYRPKNSKDKLKIPFSFHEKSKETKNLLKEYSKAQKKLSSLLEKQNFIECLLKKLNIDGQILKIQLGNDFEKMANKEGTGLSQILARSIKHTFAEQISLEFIEGMRAAQETNQIQTDTELKDLKFLDALREQAFSSSKQQKFLQFFQKIENKANVHCLIPNKLYFYTLKEGDPTKPILNHKNIRANYLVKTMSGEIISGVYKNQPPLKLNLENVFPGLAHGMIGMREGEIREIYIHPDFVYGTCLKFGGREVFQVQIELIDIDTGNDSNVLKLPYLQPVDVRMVTPDIKDYKEFNALQKKYNYLCGMKTWLHYKKAKNLIDFDQVIKEILSGTAQNSYTEQERETMALLNWIIYQANDDDCVNGRRFLKLMQ